jgi:hypothetical protein
MHRYIIGAIIVTLMLGVTHWRAYNMGAASVQQSWDKERAEQALALAAAERAARDAEQRLQEAANQYQTERQHEISALRRRHVALIDSMRDRASRQTVQVPGDTCNAKAGTGAGLSREDAEFLAGEAARADALRSALQACYKQYDAAREMTRK